MVSPRITIFLLAVLFFISPATAQVPEKTIPPDRANRESEIQRSLEDYYATEINKCREHITTLTRELMQLETRIRELKSSALLAENDHATWLKSSRHSAQARQLKQQELDEHLKKIRSEISSCLLSIKTKEGLLEELRSLKDRLEKDRDFILNKPG